MNRVNRILLISVLLVVLLSAFAYAAVPFGATVTVGANTTATADVAGSSPAIAGNITSLTITGFSVTQTWQGYHGNVTGVITLEDNNGNVMYNWSESSPEGEIFASTNNTVYWNNIQCLNLTSDGTYGNDIPNAGNVSQFGTNLTLLEDAFNIVSDDPDGVNETFFVNGTQAQGEGLIHDEFHVASYQFTPGECEAATHLFADSNSSEDSSFQEVLLYEPSSYSVVFISILDEDEQGFDDTPHDFQMIVLEDGHGIDTATNTYYFWVELE